MQKIIVILIAIIMLFNAAALSASEVSVSISGGIEKIDSFDENGVLYFSMSQLAKILGERISWETVGVSAIFLSDSNQLIFYFGSPYIYVKDTVLNITYPAKSKKGALFLPIETFIPILDLIRPEQISWDSDRALIRVDLEWYNITDLSFSPKTNGLLIELFITEPTEYEIYISEGNWLNITIPDGRVNRRQLLARADKKYIRDMNVEQFEKSAQISVRTRRNIEKYTHRFQANPGRLQISLVDTSKVSLASRDQREIGPDDRIDKIIIDAGHGGKDYGAVGRDRTHEKKVVLDIAKRLAKLIREEKIFEAVMTREKDKYVTLEERTRIANEANGDIFVSIHANAALKKSVRGFQVFFLAPALNDEARALVQLENAPFLAEANAFSAHRDDNLSFILSDMIQTEFQAESADLASMTDREFRSRLKKDTKARGIDQAGFYVLNGVYMPSILVESAFLTNTDDEELLQSKKYRQKVAEAVYAGLKRFKAKYGN